MPVKLVVGPPTTTFAVTIIVPPPHENVEVVTFCWVVARAVEVAERKSSRAARRFPSARFLERATPG